MRPQSTARAEPYSPFFVPRQPTPLYVLQNRSVRKSAIRCRAAQGCHIGQVFSHKAFRSERGSFSLRLWKTPGRGNEAHKSCEGKGLLHHAGADMSVDQFSFFWKRISSRVVAFVQHVSQ